MVEARISLEGGLNEADGDAEDNNEDGIGTEKEIEGDQTYHCHVLLEFRKPLHVTYCDLAMTRDSKHVAEPWSLEQAEEWEVLQGKESGMWEKSRTIILHNS